jgi:uncharacterized protein YejL (UPF0352 family)
VEATDARLTLATEEIDTATPDAAMTIAPADLTLTKISETVIALVNRSRRDADATASAIAIRATVRPPATVSAPPILTGTAAAQATEAVVTSTTEAVTTVAPEQATDAIGAATLDAATEEAPPTDAVPTATLEAAMTIAPDGLTLTKISETVVALVSRSRRDADATASAIAIEATVRPPATLSAPHLSTGTAAALATEAVVTATSDAVATVAPSQVTDAFGAATFELATDEAPPRTTDAVPAATLEAVTTVAPTDLKLTTIGETVVALVNRSRRDADATASAIANQATETPSATAAATAPVAAALTPAKTVLTVDNTDTPASRIPSALTASVTPTAADGISRAPTVESTATPLPFYFARLIPTPTAFGSSGEPPPPACEVEQAWEIYEVQAGDTLLSLAVATGSSLIELRDGNCFEPIRAVFSGDRLLVPRIPSEATTVPAPPQAGDITLHSEGCDQPEAQILLPAPGAIVHDIFALHGSALLSRGGHYRISLKTNAVDDYHMYWISEQSIHDDVLGLVNTEVFGAGTHRIRLEIVDRYGETISGGICDIPVEFGAP